MTAVCDPLITKDAFGLLYPDIDSEVAEWHIGTATDLIVDQIGFHPAAATGYVVTLPGVFRSDLTLDRAPVTGVSKVDWIDPYANVVTLETDQYVWQSIGWLKRLGGDWGGSTWSVQVTYDYGYATIPRWLQNMCATVAARGAGGNLGDIKQESIGSYSVTYETGSTTGELLPTEIRRLRRRFHGHVGTAHMTGLRW